MGILIVPLHLPGDGPGLRQQQAQGPAAGLSLARVSLRLARGWPGFPCGPCAVTQPPTTPPRPHP